ncbi:alpha/beta hydrolase [Streptomyces orinoci]|uniref:Alpha/beta hydrolase n=1 Tax=Streptomyces orinoci TaxID=67339 RepID=A0ABV3K1R7_STRON|nr:alpha/beta hydrolase [Streptomyces orinoci]
MSDPADSGSPGDPAAEAGALLALPYAPPDETVAYGPHPSQVVDRYLPGRRGRNAGARVALLHGGFWREAYDRRHLAPCARALAELGFEVALVEYRRVGGGGGWPESFLDVRRAVGGDGAAAGLVVGHSAGGHLALLLAAAGVAPVVALAPVADLALADELGLSGGAVREFLGGAACASADPMAWLPLRAPARLLHGARDTEVPVTLSRRFAGAAGAPLRVLSGVGHYALITPGAGAFGALVAVLGHSRR